LNCTGHQSGSIPKNVPKQFVPIRIYPDIWTWTIYIYIYIYIYIVIPSGMVTILNFDIRRERIE